MDRSAFKERVRGSLLGGAVGDALGAGVEFRSLAEIRRLCGKAGVDDYVEAYGRVGAITDDTQMTMFTAEGVIRAWVRSAERGICGVSGVIHHAYLRWLLTQGAKPAAEVRVGTDGWLFGVRALHSPRAPGNTCLSALRASDEFASPAIARNDSKGCGGVMRVAPIGLFAPAIGGDGEVFEMALEAAALTHGHPSGYLAAGYLAVVIARVVQGDTLSAALDAADDCLGGRRGAAEISAAIEAARSMARAGRPTPEHLEGLGGGWVAEEALAIGICCAMVARDFTDGVLLAVNHSGDSDSTGSIAGNILGAQLGIGAIPSKWLDCLELRVEIDRLAADLAAVAVGERDADELTSDYPGW